MKYRLLTKITHKRVIPLIFLFVFPASTTYQLKSFEFGGGGGETNSSLYKTEAVLGESTGQQSSTFYKTSSGLTFVQNANVPSAPTFTNDSSWYNKLKLVLTASSDASDTTYAIAISSDNWVTTNYVKSDGTVGSSLATSDYQTYSAWGGASGSYVIGLTGGTPYKVKVKAMQGNYTESAYGPEASAATTLVSLTFDIDISATDQSTNPPYVLNIGNLSQGSVTTATQKIWVSLSTNAANGGSVFIYDQYGGLKSGNLNYIIPSASTDLTGVTEGFGIQGSSTTQASGGPLTLQSPYNGSSQTVGILDTTIRTVYTSSNVPVTGGRGSLLIKAKTSNLTPASSDYVDGVTLVSSASF